MNFHKLEKWGVRAGIVLTITEYRINGTKRLLNIESTGLNEKSGNKKGYPTAFHTIHDLNPRLNHLSLTVFCCRIYILFIYDRSGDCELMQKKYLEQTAGKLQVKQQASIIIKVFLWNEILWEQSFFNFLCLNSGVQRQSGIGRKRWIHRDSVGFSSRSFLQINLWPGSKDDREKRGFSPGREERGVAEYPGWGGSREIFQFDDLQQWD